MLFAERLIYVIRAFYDEKFGKLRNWILLRSAYAGKLWVDKGLKKKTRTRITWV